MSEDRVARAALSLLGRPGDLTVLGLVDRLGPAGALELLAERLRAEGTAAPTLSEGAACLESAARRGFRFLVPTDAEWPLAVEELDREDFRGRRSFGAPTGIWLCGQARLDDLTARAVAIVGTRTPTDYGVRSAKSFAYDFARAGWTVVSGAAYGIDAAAHYGALAGGGCTVAVLAGGIDVHYPRGNSAMLERVAAGGLIVSELPPGLPVTRHRFLVRNRLISALSAGSVIVEAGLRSGARNTLAHARALSRPTFAVPGRIDAAMAAGALAEIRECEAIAITGARDVIDLLGPLGEGLAGAPSAPASVRDRVTDADHLVLEAVPAQRPVTSDFVARAAGLGALETATALVRLETLGLLRRTPEGWALTGRGRLPSAAPD